MCPRPKRVRGGEQVHEYVLLVEGHRVDGKVRQRVWQPWADSTS
jgi:hypothetical protein